MNLACERRSLGGVSFNLARHLAKGAYLNFLDAADEGRLHDTYPDGTYQRLAEVKRHYDPGNRFRRKLNIPPANEGSTQYVDGHRAALDP